ncbi:conserved protein of unknown function [Tenacibaculum sp. 190524A02b]|uniref:hypothetical protein n=1 Tax=Tenacibaculum vairaonense TaxID=3137860 RepID=UPI0032B124F9
MRSIYLTLLFLLLSIGVKAQDDITLFRLINNDSSSNKTFLASYNPSNNLLEPKEITNSNFDLKTGYLNALMLVPHPTLKNEGGVLIALAKNKKLFLKIKFGRPFFENYSKETIESEKNKYIWYLNYAGDNTKVSLVPYTNNDGRRGMVRSGGNYWHTIYHDSNGIRRSDSNKDTWKVDNGFIFSLQSIQNSL